MAYLIIAKEHIVRLVDYSDEQGPQMIMEYFPLGNLEDQHKEDPIALEESTTVLLQGLDALTYLHENEVAHRDIKPENILVQSRSPFHIKLSDFGLAKNATELVTYCGSPFYAAPEIYKTGVYTPAVDLWSLGVVVYQYIYSLPILKRKYFPKRWFDALEKSISDWDSDPMIDFMSTHMLRVNPGERSSAKDCSQRALAVFEERRTPLVTEPLWANPQCDQEPAAINEAGHSQRRNRRSASRKSSDDRNAASKRRRSTINNSRENLTISAARVQGSLKRPFPHLNARFSSAVSSGRNQAAFEAETVHNEEFVPMRGSTSAASEADTVHDGFISIGDSTPARMQVRRSKRSFAPSSTLDLQRLPSDQI